MTVQGRGRRAFDEDDVVFAEAVARILGIAVQRQAGAGAAEPHCC
jgi:GAF domain-containing protein